jgi:hypothetical protein
MNCLLLIALCLSNSACWFLQAAPCTESRSYGYTFNGDTFMLFRPVPEGTLVNTYIRVGGDAGSP